MLKVYGASDDLIEIKGDIREEFSRYDSEGDYLAFSDGTVLKPSGKMSSSIFEKTGKIFSP